MKEVARHSVKKRFDYLTVENKRRSFGTSKTLRAQNVEMQQKLDENLRKKDSMADEDRPKIETTKNIAFLIINRNFLDFGIYAKILNFRTQNYCTLFDFTVGQCGLFQNSEAYKDSILQN